MYVCTVCLRYVQSMVTLVATCWASVVARSQHGAILNRQRCCGRKSRKKGELTGDAKCIKTAVVI